MRHLLIAALVLAIGPPAAGVQYVHVFDRGADNLDVFCHLLEQRSDWVIRAAQLHRNAASVQTIATRVRSAPPRAVITCARGSGPFSRRTASVSPSRNSITR